MQLHITIPSRELYDEQTNTFHTINGCEFTLLHSLVSVSKWEAKWKKPFLSEEEMTNEEFIDYLYCMIITPDVDEDVHTKLNSENTQAIVEYIKDSQTASSVHDARPNQGKQRTITSELIYSWMATLQIDWSAENWHLNRLLMLIKIINIENAPDKKRSKADSLNYARQLNAARRRKK